MRKFTLFAMSLFSSLGVTICTKAENVLLNSEQQLPGTLVTLDGADHQQYEWTSPEFNAPTGGMNTIRLTFLENSKREHTAGYPFVTIAEFYLYDAEGNKVDLTSLETTSIFSSNATETKEGGQQCLNDGILTGRDDAHDWYWHSFWSSNVGENHYLELDVSDLNADLSKFKIGYVSRKIEGAPSEILLTTGSSHQDVAEQASVHVRSVYKDDNGATLGEEIIYIPLGATWKVHEVSANLMLKETNIPAPASAASIDILMSGTVEYVYVDNPDVELPFSTTDYYVLSVRNNTKWLYAGEDDDVCFSSKGYIFTDYEKYCWTLEGDGFNGYSIKNKSGKYLESVDSNPGNGSVVRLSNTKSEKTTFHVIQGTTAGDFLFKLSGVANACPGDYQGLNVLKFWVDSNNLSDPGSIFVPCNVSETELFNDWKEGQLRAIGCVGGYAYSLKSVVEGLTLDNYREFLDAKHEKNEIDPSKFYIFESDYRGFTDGKSRVITGDDAKNLTWREYTPDNVNAIWQIEETQTEGMYHLKSVNRGLYAESSSYNAPFVFKEEAKEYYFLPASNGKCSAAVGIRTSLGSNDCVTFAMDTDAHPAEDATSGRIVSYNDLLAADRATAWLIREATELEVALHEAKGAFYATTYLPFAASVKSGATAYTGTMDGTMLKAKAVAGAFPAETGVILKSDEAAEKAVLAIGGDVEGDFDKGILEGTLTGKVYEDELTFGLSNTDDGGELGFFHYTGGTRLAANKAFLPAPAEGVKGFVLDFGGAVTGIEGLNPSSTNAGVLYDLSGRRVQKAVKGGIYLQNGKKFIAQ